MSLVYIQLFCLLKMKANLHTDKLAELVYQSNSGYTNLILLFAKKIFKVFVFIIKPLCF